MLTLNSYIIVGAVVYILLALAPVFKQTSLLGMMEIMGKIFGDVGRESFKEGFASTSGAELTNSGETVEGIAPPEEDASIPLVGLVISTVLFIAVTVAIAFVWPLFLASFLYGLTFKK